MGTGNIDRNRIHHPAHIQPAAYQSACLLQHIQVKAFYITCCFQERYKLIWRYDAQLRMVPSDQCLAACPAVRLQMVLCLQIQLQLTPLQGMLKVLLQPFAHLLLLIHPLVIKHHCVAALLSIFQGRNCPLISLVHVAALICHAGTC